MRRTLLLIAAGTLPALAVVGAAAAFVLSRPGGGDAPAAVATLEQRAAAEAAWQDVVEPERPSFGSPTGGTVDGESLEPTPELKPDSVAGTPTGGTETDASSEAPPATTDGAAAEEAADDPGCTYLEEKRLTDERGSYAAVVKRRATAFSEPGGVKLQTFEHLNVNRVPTVFAVVGAVVDQGCDPLWYRVQLPVRPNGTEGYVRAGAVDVFRIGTRIEIDLSERTLTFTRAGKVVLRAPVAIGTSENPTPVGRFYVNQRLRAGDPSGPFGPAALGLSAFAPNLSEWAQGGPVAIHGTNDPGGIGQAISHGCVRLTNDQLTRLYAATPAGTPVVIHP
ncbi:MAG: L,D-transpeptidase [Thermoleophilia bacterium]